MIAFNRKGTGVVTIPEAFAVAVGHHQGGRIAEAAALYRQILAVDPANAATLNNLGLIVTPDEAVTLFRAALAVQPDYIDAYMNLGTALKGLGQGEEAISCYQRAAQLRPGSADAQFNLALALMDQGRLVEAETAFRRVLSAQPMTHYLTALAILEPLLQRQNRVDEAITLYEDAMRLSPGNAFPGTRRALLLVRQQWGAPPAPALVPPGDRITMSSLGQNGRFGNQILQYGFLRTYAHVHGLQWEAPDWIGRDVFGHDDPLISQSLPLLREDEADVIGSLRKTSPDVFSNRDFWGYFVGETSVYAPHKDFYRSLFTLSDAARGVVEPAVARLRARGRTLVAMHLRRGDFGYGQFWIAPEAWYLAWLREIWPILADPVLFIATDDPAIAAAFSAFSPMTGADLPPSPAGIEFLVDFGVLLNADVLAVSNSSFSFTASMLNTNARITARPSRERQELILYDPWAAPPLI